MDAKKCDLTGEFFLPSSERKLKYGIICIDQMKNNPMILEALMDIHPKIQIKIEELIESHAQVHYESTPQGVIVNDEQKGVESVIAKPRRSYPLEFSSLEEEKLLKIIEKSPNIKMGSLYKIFVDAGFNMNYKRLQREINQLAVRKLIDIEKLSGGPNGSTTLIKIKRLGRYGGKKRYTDDEIKQVINREIPDKDLAKQLGLMIKTISCYRVIWKKKFSYLLKSVNLKDQARREFLREKQEKENYSSIIHLKNEFERNPKTKRQGGSNGI